ncbi:hypothetical protein GCM10027046_27910 [Uliginosibacterium flavum]|uniref:CHASE domain-containing protein n=1 Tax=Uliginosibacterium flavum TaxID=1396831 RepID=A0ABV2TGZ2_9RHOO
MLSLRPHLPAALALAVSLGVTGLLWQHEQTLAEQNLHARFDDSLRDTTSRIVQRMSAYEQMLRGVQGYHAGSAQIDRKEFTAYIDSLQLGADFSGIQGVGLITLTPAAGKEALSARMRAQGFPDYTIKPAGEREVYAAIVQVEPFSGRNLVALGFDPYTDPVRREAMDAARDAGAPRITRKLQQVLDRQPDEGPSFILYAPLYRHSAATDSVALRRANIVGWVYAPVRLAELMGSLYGEAETDVAIRLFDGITAEPAAQFFSTHPDSPPARMHTREYLEVGGLSWTVEARALSGFEARFGSKDAGIIAISGVCLSLLLAMLTHLLVSARQIAIGLAHAMTEDLRRSEERWKYALEGAGDGVWDRDLRTDEVFYSQRCLEIFGYTESEIRPVRSEWVERIHPEDRDMALAASYACVTGQQDSFASEYRLRCKDGRWKWVLLRGRVMSHDADGKPLRLIGTVSDIDARKAIEEQVRHMAQHDTLTNLPNRALFVERQQQALSLARRDHSQVALLFVDLDEFKSINDHFGHAIGDLLLQEVAQRMLTCVRESDTVGRIGGDEFIVLLTQLHNAEDARNIGEKIRASLAEPFILDRQTIRISASIGIASNVESTDDAGALWMAADVAMYAAKAGGGNQIALSTDEAASSAG